MKTETAVLLNQIDALLDLNARGATTPRVPGLAVELLNSAAKAIVRLEEEAALARFKAAVKL